ncbi:MAG: hypothetical protein JSW64_04630 [Candidatus Zixiibacteriota bacterium]|nr:MAG: hypothetical protein JSW64_04630 [candidate division Zixibacteria bacterium]
MIKVNLSYNDVVKIIAKILKDFDSEYPRFKKFKPGIGPYGEPQIVKIISRKLSRSGILAKTRRCPDLEIGYEWAIEFKIVRPFGDNGKEAENWSVNLLHPYAGNTSLIGDAMKLIELTEYKHKGLFVIGYEHKPAKISLDPLINSFEVLMKAVVKIKLGQRIESCYNGLVHPEHQVVRCIGWEL